MTNIDIYQGKQIGGCVTVITVQKGEEIHRIMIDYGEPLPGNEVAEKFDYPWDEAPIDAVFFTHYHEDHVGRILDVPKGVTIYLGAIAREVMMNTYKYLSYMDGSETSPHKKKCELLHDDSKVRTFHYDPQKRCFDAICDIPFFRIEPYRVDHSAYDAYMFLIEAEDETKTSGKKVIVHTGDFRGHGKRGNAMLKMIDSYIHKNYGGEMFNGKNEREIDVLIIEGTLMSRLSENVKTLKQMEKEAEEYLREHRHAFLICAATNLDSLASFYRAWRKVSGSGYIFTYNRYYKDQLMTFSNTVGRYSYGYNFKKVYHLDLDKKIPQGGGDKPRTQKELMKEKGFLAVIKPDSFCEQYIDAFMDCEDKPIIIYSKWAGYLNPKNKAYHKDWDEFLKAQEAKGIEVIHLHTSGHATPKMIIDVIEAIDPQEEIIPVHTECPDKFDKLEIKPELKKLIRRKMSGE